MNKLCLGLRRWVLGTLLGLWAWQGPAAPRVPVDDNEVLQVLPRVPGGAVARSQARKASRTASVDPDAAAAEARRWIALNRSASDPRCLGRAQAALAPWWRQEDPPVAIRLLRAEIRQCLHEFPAALADLDAVLRVDPSHAQAWLTKSALHTVRAEWPEAAAAVLPLRKLSGRLVSATAEAAVCSLLGRAEDAARSVERALREDPSAPASVRVWSMTLLAEIATWTGRNEEADRWFEQARALGVEDAYLETAHADHLLETGRAAEVLSRLGPNPLSDGLLLRVALAGSQVTPRPEGFAGQVRVLEERFAAAHARGDAIHLREEARFELALRGHPRRALELALRNWKVQKEPADAKILLETALAVQDVGAAALVRDWLDASGFEDRRLRRRLGSLAAVP